MKIRMMVLLVALLAALPVSAQNFPQYAGAVNDFAHVIDFATESRLEAKLTDYEKTTGVAVVVATVPSLDGMDEDEYANRLFTQWGIGHKGKDNGVLVLLAPKERKVRIEVGYGLEGVLTDGRTGQILDNYGVPNFRNQQWSEGVEQTVDGIINSLDRNLSSSRAGEFVALEKKDIHWSIYALVYLVLVLLIIYLVFFQGTGLGSSMGDQEYRERKEEGPSGGSVPSAARTSSTTPRSSTPSFRKSSSSSANRSSSSSRRGGFGGFGGGRSGGGGSSRGF